MQVGQVPGEQFALIGMGLGVDDLAGEDVEHHVRAVPDALDRPALLGDAPGPALVGAGGAGVLLDLLQGLVHDLGDWSWTPVDRRSPARARRLVRK